MMNIEYLMDDGGLKDGAPPRFGISNKELNYVKFYF